MPASIRGIAHGCACGSTAKRPRSRCLSSSACAPMARCWTSRPANPNHIPDGAPGRNAARDHYFCYYGFGHDVLWPSASCQVAGAGSNQHPRRSRCAVHEFRHASEAAEPPRWGAQMPSHKFKIGEIVMLKGSVSRNVPGGIYEVVSNSLTMVTSSSIASRARANRMGASREKPT